MLALDNLRLLSPYILVKRLPTEGHEKFGELMIQLPDSQNFRNRRCEVVSTHYGRRFEEGAVRKPTVDKGQLVELILFDGDPLDKIDHPDIEVCREENILCIVTEDGLKPLEDRIVIKASSPALVTQGGIHLPELHSDRPYKGTVVAVGPGRTSRYGASLSMDTEPGDVIYFEQYKGIPVKHRGETFLILEEKDILMGVEEVHDHPQS